MPGDQGKKTTSRVREMRRTPEAIQRLRLQQQEEMRQKLHGGRILEKIDGYLKELDELQRDLKSKRKAYKGGDLECMRIRLKVVQAAIDVNFRKLNKILPDIKHVDLSAGEQGDILEMYMAEFAKAVKAKSGLS